MDCYLAVDIGASSGRHIVGWMENEKFRMREIYRFPNAMVRRNGHLYWDTENLLSHILRGMHICGQEGFRPVSMAVDTWAVDYALIDQDGRLACPVFAYRDHRTREMDKQVYRQIGPKELYRRTGIQKQPFNTVFQLTACRQLDPDALQKARHILLLPDYFHFLLTGVVMTEYTNATTTQLVNALRREWDDELIGCLGLPRGLFGTITPPGTRVGNLRPEIAEQVGFQTCVMQTASHDTASAVAAVPAREKDFLYISSGTWSLMGTELEKPILTEESMNRNLTNEGGWGYRIRYLKNIMGLWMIQCVQKELQEKYSFSELVKLARESLLDSLVNCDDNLFMAPSSMMEAVRQKCRESNQQEPVTPGDFARVIYRSLAHGYQQTVSEIEKITGKHFSSIHTVGGGSQNSFLNELTAASTGKPVLSGPAEATAIGNILVQMTGHGVFDSIEEARETVARSFRVEQFLPQ
jgi:rhamnulokinase